jgi:hypothetical protein
MNHFEGVAVHAVKNQEIPAARRGRPSDRMLPNALEINFRYISNDDSHLEGERLLLNRARRSLRTLPRAIAASSLRSI